MERLLERDGLSKLPLVVVSARSGDGIPELQRLLADRVAARDAAVAKLAADLSRRQSRWWRAARAAGAASGQRTRGDYGRRSRRRRAFRLSSAPSRSPPAARRSRDGLATRPLAPPVPARPAPPPQAFGVAGAADAHLDAAADGRPAGAGGECVAPPGRRGGRRPRAALAAARAGSGIRGRRAGGGPSRPSRGRTDLRVSRPRWWRVAGGLQSALAIALTAGAAWLAVLALLGWLRIEDVVPLPEVAGIPIPTWLLLGGAAAGLVWRSWRGS